MVFDKLSVSHKRQEFSLNGSLYSACNFYCYSRIHRETERETGPVAASDILRIASGRLSALFNTANWLMGKQVWTLATLASHMNHEKKIVFFLLEKLRRSYAKWYRVREIRQET